MFQRIMWLLLAVFIGLSVFVFTIFFEKVTHEEDQGYSAEARANPFLAAKILLENLGVRVNDDTSALDISTISANDSIFLSDVNDLVFSPSKIVETLDWVDRGGDLIAGVGSETEGASSLLYQLEVDAVQYDIDYDEILDELIDDDDLDKPFSERLREFNKRVDDEQAEQASKEVDGSETNDSNQPNKEGLLGAFSFKDKRERYVVKLADSAGQLTLETVDRIVLNQPYAGDWLEDENDSDQRNSDESYSAESYSDSSDSDAQTAWVDYQLDSYASDSRGPRVLQFAYGEGTITLLSSSELWQNSEIGRADHGYFLAYLIGDTAVLHLFYNIVSPSLFTLLRQYFPELLIALAFLLLLWLWRSGLRVQGVKMLDNVKRRDFNEHLVASAEFLLDKRHFSVLLDPIKDEISTKMRSAQVNFSALAPAAQASLLESQTKLPIESINRWLAYTHAIKSQEELINAIKLGTLIRSSL